MKRFARVNSEVSARELLRLSHESRDSLAQRWADLFGATPPPRTSRSLMMRAVAYKIQERACGGLPAAIRRMLVDEPGVSQSRRLSKQTSAGTVLLREWHGTTHQVTISEGGVLYRGKRYRSLSEVARIITGSRWSGPAFFGLKKNDKS